MGEPVWLLESPISIVAHASVSIPLTVVFPWATSVSAVSDVKVYKGTEDTTATNMPSGSHTSSGNSLTTKNLTALVPGATYTIVIVATVDGITDAWMLEVRARDPKVKQ
jgi:hypothetical protein